MRKKQDAFSQFHPMINFLYFLFVIGAAVIIQHPVYVLTGCVSGAVYLICLQGRKGWRFLLGTLPLLLILTALNPLFNTAGSHILFYVFGRPYTGEALLYGSVIGGILVGTLLWFGCYQEVLTSDKFLYLFGTRIPALSLLLTMIFRLVPNFLRRGREIYAARTAVGKGEKNLKEGLSVMSALTSWALEGSIITSDSMASRGYGTGKRTGFHRYAWEIRDWVTAIFLILAIGFFFALGDTKAAFTPQFSCAPITIKTGIGLIAYAFIGFLPAILHSKEVLMWHIYKWKI